MKLSLQFCLNKTSIVVLLLAALPRPCNSRPHARSPGITQANHADHIQLDLPCGPILANLEHDIIYARGIRYASAKRFEKPAPIGSWTDVKDCTQPATICPQNPSRFDFLTGPLTANRSQSEDCLHVSVAAPTNVSDLPVMVFLHGGAYLTGGGDLDAYNPVPLARKGVVVVSVTYRLGVLGYLPIPNISPANIGLFDQIEALRWVQRNIRSFGGDPDRVTVFGQSAGGDSVFCLLAANNTKHLFHHAILESATLGRLNETTRDAMTAAMSVFAASNISASPAPPSLQQLLALQTAVLSIARPVDPTLVAYGPIFGQDPLPALSELSSAVTSAAKRISVFMGYNKDEGSPFAHLDPSHSAAYYKKTVFEDGANQLAENISDATGAFPPMYHFNWSPLGSPWGAPHTMELPFLVGKWEAWAGAAMLNGSESKEVVERVGSEMKDLWIAFARGEDLKNRLFVIDGDFRFDS